MRSIILIAHDMRSCHNVGSLLRTADGLGVELVYLTGYTPYPAKPDDPRLPHLALKLTKDIHKTALGAEETVEWHQSDTLKPVLAALHKEGYVLAALEQTVTSQTLNDFVVPDKVAIILGREVEGIDPEIISQCDTTLEIPMFGSKESFNVVQAAAMVLYHCRFA